MKSRAEEKTLAQCKGCVDYGGMRECAENVSLWESRLV